jgi:aerobic-type carbon monoxide dehydrogenase small subunit (CoxS/CutS family)
MDRDSQLKETSSVTGPVIQDGSSLCRTRPKQKISIDVNGKTHLLEVEARWTLAEVLRQELRLTGTKIGCNRAECGACTVLMDNLPVFSCTVLAVEAAGKRIETIESLSGPKRLHPLQYAFIKFDALQCGFCTPGIMMSLKTLLDTNPSPSKEDIKMAIAGVYCRCGAYPNIIEATLDAAATQRSRLAHEHS